jgi:hypothetical protein
MVVTPSLFSPCSIFCRSLFLCGLVVTVSGYKSSGPGFEFMLTLYYNNETFTAANSQPRLHKYLCSFGYISISLKLLIFCRLHWAALFLNLNRFIALVTSPGPQLFLSPCLRARGVHRYTSIFPSISRLGFYRRCKRNGDEQAPIAHERDCLPHVPRRLGQTIEYGVHIRGDLHSACDFTFRSISKQQLHFNTENLLFILDLFNNPFNTSC